VKRKLGSNTNTIVFFRYPGKYMWGCFSEPLRQTRRFNPSSVWTFLWMSWNTRRLRDSIPLGGGLGTRPTWIWSRCRPQFVQAVNMRVGTGPAKSVMSLPGLSGRKWNPERRLLIQLACLSVPCESVPLPGQRLILWTSGVKHPQDPESRDQSSLHLDLFITSSQIHLSGF